MTSAPRNMDNIPNAIVSAMLSQRKSWTAAIKSKDAVAAAAYYSEDGVVSPYGMPNAVGRPAIAKVIDHFMTRGMTDIQISMAEVGTFDPDHAKAPRTVFERGTFKIISGTHVLDAGKYLNVWKNVDDHWLIYRDIFNSDTGIAPRIIGNIPDSVVANIQGRLQSWMAAAKAKDAAGVAALYAEDGMLMPNGLPNAVGRNAIAKVIDTFFALGVTEAKLHTEELAAFDHDSTTSPPTVVCERGSYKLYAGTQHVETGKYLIIWKCIDGQWFYYRDCFNSDGDANKPAA